MENLLRDYRINKSWLARELGIPRSTFDYARARGLRPEEQEAIQGAIQRAGREIVATRLSNPPREQISRLQQACGVRLSWLAEATGKTSRALHYAVKHGFTAHDLAHAQAALIRMGCSMIRFRFDS